jgi:hypothetical protein
VEPVVAPFIATVTTSRMTTVITVNDQITGQVYSTVWFQKQQAYFLRLAMISLPDGGVWSFSDGGRRRGSGVIIHVI